jgi:amino acid transporter
MATSLSSPAPGSNQINLVAAVSIGIGGMVGAGIFSILGVVAQAAGNAMWLAFAIGGVVALLSTYSYARLGATFTSAGGPVHFLVKSFGDGVLAGGLNLFMWAGYIIRSRFTPGRSAATRPPLSPIIPRRCCSMGSQSARWWC